MSINNYSVQDAIDYANRYYENYNPAYPDWNAYGGDCANFISQCLHAGGVQMKGRPGTATQATNLSNWFSAGNQRNVRNVSSTWRGADAFRHYWMKHANYYKVFSAVGTEAYKFGHKGDFISLLARGGNAYHTLLIIDYDTSETDFIVATHTYDTNTNRLSGYQPEGGFIIYSVR